MATLQTPSSTWARQDHIKVFSRMTERKQQLACGPNPRINNTNNSKQRGLMERHSIRRAASRKATIHAACESQITVFVGDRYYDRCSTLRPIRRSTVRCDQQQHRRSASWSRSRGLLEVVGLEACKRFRECFASCYVLRSCKFALAIENHALQLITSSFIREVACNTARHPTTTSATG